VEGGEELGGRFIVVRGGAGGGATGLRGLVGGVDGHVSAVYRAEVVLAKDGVLECVDVGDVTFRCPVELVWVLMGEAVRCEDVEFVGGPRSGAEEGSEVKRGVTGGNVGLLSEGNGAEAWSSTGTQFDCCRSGCPRTAFISSAGRRL